MHKRETCVENLDMVSKQLKDLNQVCRITTGAVRVYQCRHICCVFSFKNLGNLPVDAVLLTNLLEKITPVAK